MISEAHLKQKLQRMRRFWNREPVERPLIGFQIGKNLPTSRLEAGPWLPGTEVELTPAMVHPEEILEEYEALYQAALHVEQDVVWTAEPYHEIPWMEGVFGCSVFASQSGFFSKPSIRHLDGLAHLILSEDNPWYQKYFEFLEALIKASNGRYPIGQPILRGPGDILAAVMSQQTVLCALYEFPEQIKRFIERVTEFLISFVHKQEDLLPEFHGGYSLGYFHVWCPERCLWFQDDFSNVFSPTCSAVMVKKVLIAEWASTVVGTIIVITKANTNAIKSIFFMLMLLFTIYGILFCTDFNTMLFGFSDL